jgi:hypothetical protein
MLSGWLNNLHMCWIYLNLSFEIPGDPVVSTSLTLTVTNSLVWSDAETYFKPEGTLPACPVPLTRSRDCVLLYWQTIRVHYHTPTGRHIPKPTRTWHTLMVNNVQNITSPSAYSTGYTRNKAIYEIPHVNQHWGALVSVHAAIIMNGHAI